jgi:5-methylcytosine-specific restriction endonuclease McrA
MKKTLVLSRSFRAIGIVNYRNVFYKLATGAYEVIEYWPDVYINSPHAKHQLPSIVRVNHPYEPDYKKLALTRPNVFLRDGHKCVYCGSTFGLTLDHVYPKSKGGLHKWNNVVTACKACNGYKSDTTLEDLREQASTPEDVEKWTLDRKPYRPSIFMKMHNIGGENTPESWKPYLWL